jgi:SAM-dependent methyltransferase
VALAPDGLSIYESDQSVFEVDGNDEYYRDEGTADAARAKLQFVRRFCGGPDPLRLLDVGASFGHFLIEAQPHFRAFGIELNERSVTWSVKHFDVNNVVASLYDLPTTLPACFDVITAWDVIEHLDDPRRALATLHDRLAPGGWLFVSTPDAGSWVARALGRYWHYEDPIQHINLFSRVNVERLLRESGFQPYAANYLGRRYRINYILNRLRYLADGGVGRRLIAPLTRLPEWIRRGHVTIKLWDVVAVAARRA